MSDKEFAALHRRYEKKLLNFCLRYSIDEQDAKDAVQETFIRVYKNQDKIDPAKKISTYLFEIAKNQSIDIWRKKHRQVPLPEDLVAEPIPETIDYNFVHLAINSLETKYRQVINMHYFEDLSYKSIASRLSLPVNTVRTYLHRGKLKLKKILRRQV